MQSVMGLHDFVKEKLKRLSDSHYSIHRAKVSPTDDCVLYIVNYHLQTRFISNGCPGANQHKKFFRARFNFYSTSVDNLNASVELHFRFQFY